MAFSHKQIAVTFLYQKGAIDGSGGHDTIKLSGPLRAHVQVNFVGGPSQTTATLSVFGLTLSHMNRFATLGLKPTEQRTNQVLIEAGDTTTGLGTVFSGTITDAYADFSGMPECAFYVKAHSGGITTMKPIPPTSYRGLVDVATIMSGIATQMGLGFENNGVTGQLASPYYPGTAWDQADACAKAAGFNWAPVDGVLAIWPTGGARGGTAVVVSPETGMVGYPSFNSYGIEVTSLYNPSIAFGGTVEVSSQLPAARGIWQVHSLQHFLQSETPGGQWSTHFSAVRPGFNATSAG